MANTSHVVVNSGATFDISGISVGGQTIARLDYSYSGGSVVLGSKNLTLGGGNYNSWSDGSISGNGGSITKNGAGTFYLGGTNTYTGPTTVNGGSVEMSGSSTTSLVINNGSLVVLNGTNTGNASVNSGTLVVNGTQTGNVTIASGSKVGGAGSITGTLSVGAGGTLAPGSSIETLSSGTLSFAHNSTFAYEVDFSVLATSAADLQVVLGDLNLSGLVNLTLTDLAGSPSTFEPGTIFSLINYTGAWNGGLFTFGGVQIADEGVFTAGLNTWKIDYNAPNGGLNFSNQYAGGSDSFVNITRFVIVPVPEPSSALLGGVGALCLLRRRRQTSARV